MRVIMQGMFRTAYQILRNNMIFIQPLLLYMLLVMSAAMYVAGKTMPLVARIVLTACVVLLTIAFMTGWFYINKLGVDKYNPEDEQEVITKKTVESFKQFFSGIGENFFKMLFAFIIFGLIYVGVSYLVVQLCLKFFGTPTIIMDFQNIAKMQTNTEIVAYLNNVSVDDKLNFISWVWTGIVLSSILNFFGVLYFSINTYEKRNVFVCLWKAFLFFFRKILSSLAIILVLFFIYFFLNLLSLLLGANSFSFAILIILFTLYLNYYVLLVMWFYNEQTKNNSDSRA